MIKNVYLMPKLKHLMANGKTGDIKRKAIATFTSMKKASPNPIKEDGVKEAEELLSSEQQTRQPQPLSNMTNKTSSAAYKGMASFGFDGSSNNKSYQATTVTVYMKELANETKKAEFEHKMVNFKGVVSFWVDLRQHKAVIRTTLSEDLMIKAIMTQLGWIASTDISFVAPKNAGYIEENDIGDGAIVHRGGRSKKSKEQQSSGWFGSVTSYLW